MRKEIEIIANAPVRFGAKFQELVEYHSLITELSKRDLKARYTQTVLGLAWAFINPLVSVLLLYFVFTVVAKTNTAGVPPLLFVMSGLCIWNFFSRVVGDSGQSLLGAQAIVKKIYFPRLIIPLSKMLVGLVDLAIVLLFLLILLLVYQFPVSWNFLLIIPILLLAMQLFLLNAKLKKRLSHRGFQITLPGQSYRIGFGHVFHEDDLLLFTIHVRVYRQCIYPSV